MINGEQDTRCIRGKKRGKSVLRNLHDGKEEYHGIGMVLWGENLRNNKRGKSRAKSK